MASEPLIVQAVYPFKGTNNDELCFKKGDKITITQKEDGGWWEGTLNGITGWFPSNYVKECKDIPLPTLISPLSQQQQYKIVVLKDLIDSERAHVTELQGLVTNFLQPLEKSTILTTDEFKQLTGNLTEVLDTHKQLLSLLEAEELKSSYEQRIGKIFMTWAPRIKTVHQAYCALHPRAVCILDKFKDELTKYMESCGAATPGVLVLTTGLSKPFRRLDKYSGMLQELERHVEESHPDRGDIQRSVAIYKDIASTCSATRRQKELELQVLTGPVRGWEGQSLSALGDIIYMGSVAVGPQHHDRYFVLFPSTLLILSVSHRLSAFIYEGKLPLSGIHVVRLEDNEQYKNAFEISGPMIEKRIAVCQSKEEANHWVDLLRKHMPRNSSASNSTQKASPSQAQLVPQPPPHLNQRGYCTRTSVINYSLPLPYTPTLPSQFYPPAAPFAALTKLFRKLIKEKVINRKMLKDLLYPEYLNKYDISLVKIRKHRTECIIIAKPAMCRISVINCDSDSDDDSDSCDDDHKIYRQNAVDDSPNSSKRSSSSSSNPFGYIRYYNPATGTEEEVESHYESFIDYGEPIKVTEPVMVADERKKSSVVVTSTAKLQLVNQLSETSDASSILAPKPYMACEDLVHLDDNVEIRTLNVPTPFVPVTRQSLPTKFVANKFSQSSLTTICTPSWQSNSDTNLVLQRANDEQFHKKSNHSSCSTTTHSSSLDLPVNTLPLPDNVVAELLYNFNSDPIEEALAQSESVESDHTELSSKTVIKPPSMFQNFSESSKRSMNVDPNLQALSLNLKNVGFRKHSINSDKPKRRSSIQIITEDLTNQSSSSIRRCVSSHFLKIRDSAGQNCSNIPYCRCCTEPCQSPRSSDSGMAGSCTLNSPDLAANEIYAAQERCSADMSILSRKYNEFNDNRNVISLSEIEARDFESQCPCTSPFGSTPRTSCQPSISSNIITGSHDSMHTSVTSHLDIFKTWDSERIQLIQPKLLTPIQPRCIEQWEQKQKSKSLGCLNKPEDQKEKDDDIGIYKSGLYAHWWLKMKIPASVVKGIYEETKKSTGTGKDVTAGCSKQFKQQPARRDK